MGVFINFAFFAFSAKARPTRGLDNETTAEGVTSEVSTASPGNKNEEKPDTTALEQEAAESLSESESDQSDDEDTPESDLQKVDKREKV